MLHPIEESLIITPKFIEKIVRADKNFYAVLARQTGVSLNTIKSYEKNKKFPNNSTTKKGIKNFVSFHGDKFGTEIELNSDLGKGRLYQKIENSISSLIQKQQIIIGGPWEELFNQPNIGYLFDIDFPRTKQTLVHLEFLKREIRKYFEEESFELSAIYLSCAVGPEIGFDGNIIKKCSRAKSKNEFIQNSLIPCFQCNLYAIASYDIESFPANTRLAFANEKERKRLERSRKNHFDLFLPILKKNQIITPIKRWYDAIKAKYNIINNEKYSWTNIIDNGVFFEGELDISLIRKWEKGQHTPKMERIDLFLKEVFPNEELILEKIFYTVAKIFQYIYEQLHDSGMKNEDIIDFFQSYNNYCKIHLKEYKSAAT